MGGSVLKKAGHVHVETMTLDFGEYKGTHIKDVPNTYLGWLTKWEVDVDVDNGRIVKETKVNASNHFGPCPCGDCSALRFLETKPDVIEAARKLASQRRLCCHCWKFMPPVGNSRRNGKLHDDWDSRFLHKKCWSEYQ